MPTAISGNSVVDITFPDRRHGYRPWIASRRLVIAIAARALQCRRESFDRSWQLPPGTITQGRQQLTDFANIAGQPVAYYKVFLSKFTKSTEWAHLDIAGVAWNEGKEKGATGRPVPLLTTWLLAQESPG
jgi:leucyl aminopeptidase